jgi:transposase InsO family protein
MSQALGVSTSGFYEWLTRPESNRSMTNRTILVRIRESFEASHQTYGSPRVWRDLRDWNVPCGENRTARLMRQAGLVARVRLKTPRYEAGRRSMIAPNVLDRQFHADAANQKWVADFTYIPTREGWLYLAVVLDLYSRMVVGWSMHRHMSTGAGLRCDDHGAMAATTHGCATALRPGLPIRQRDLSAAPLGQRYPMQHEPFWKRLGQLRHGKLLLESEN